MTRLQNFCARIACLSVCVAAGLLAPSAPAIAQDVSEQQPAPAASPEAAVAVGQVPVADEVRNAPAAPALPVAESEPRNPGLDLPTAGTPFDPLPVKPVLSQEEIERNIRRQAYDQAVTGLLPMQPHEIRGLLEEFDKTKQAVEVPIFPYPEPEIAVETVSLDPGVRPPEVKVAIGHVTTLSLLDASGEPWPIQDMSWAGNFEVIQPEEGGNIIRVTPLSDFTYGNLSIRLLKLKTPVTFILKANREKVQYRFDARIPQMGPMARPPIVDGGITLTAGSSILGAVLDGVPPDSAEKMKVSGTDGRTTAYKVGETTYVRTPLTLLSPGWSGSVSSADGMNVYSVSNAPVILLSEKGQISRVRLSKKEMAIDDK